jgi:hypothetical protein
MDYYYTFKRRNGYFEAIDIFIAMERRGKTFLWAVCCNVKHGLGCLASIMAA